MAYGAGVLIGADTGNWFRACLLDLLNMYCKYVLACGTLNENDKISSRKYCFVIHLLFYTFLCVMT